TLIGMPVNNATHLSKVRPARILMSEATRNHLSGSVDVTRSESLLLKGATILDYRVELRLLNAALFWSIRNARGERYSVIPGLNMPVGNQTYGVRWEFTN
ncbi:MAG: hypothetical protein ACHP93_07020, partial [Solirubrobacterales bacterium]